MNFDWNDKTIRWYKNANTYTGFYKNVAQAVAPLLEGCRTMADLGCGLGLIDLELASSVHHIDCIDVSLPALTSLHQSARERGIRNVHPVLQSVDSLTGAWDAALMSFFGSRVPDRFLPYGRKIVLIVCGRCQEGFIPSTYRRFQKNSSEETEKYLQENGVDYDVSYYEFEFGQPFVSAADAFEFVSLHSPGISNGEILDFLEGRLVTLRDGEYKYYIPRSKQIGVFELKS